MPLSSRSRGALYVPPDANPHPHPVAVALGFQLGVVDGETEIVESADPFPDQVSLLGADDELGGELIPQTLVPLDDVPAQGQVGLIDVEAVFRGDVGHLTGNVHLHDR